jgi:hypothetical protein
MMNLAIGLASLTAFGLLLGVVSLLIARNERLASVRVVEEEQLSLFTREGSEVKVAGELAVLRRSNR